MFTREGSFKSSHKPSVLHKLVQYIFETINRITSSKLFHASTTLCAKENFLTSGLNYLFKMTRSLVGTVVNQKTLKGLHNQNL